MNRHRLADDINYYVLAIIGWLAYAALTLFAPTPSKALFHISHFQIVELQLTLIIPVLIIWLAAAYGVSWSKHYARLLGDSPEAPAFRNIADGIFVLLVGLVAQSVIGAARPYVQTTDAVRLNVIAVNYVELIFGLAAFYLVYRGSRHLVAMVSNKRNIVFLAIWVFIIGVISAGYAWATLHNANRTVAVNSSAPATFYLSDRWIILTIIIPHIITWILAAIACFNLYFFSKFAKGIIYRRGLKYMVIGLIGVLALSVVVQLLGTASAQLLKLSLSQLLILIYALVALMGVGYTYIAWGASRLAKIEEA